MADEKDRPPWALGIDNQISFNVAIEERDTEFIQSPGVSGALDLATCPPGIPNHPAAPISHDQRVSHGHFERVSSVRSEAKAWLPPHRSTSFLDLRQLLERRQY